MLFVKEDQHRKMGKQLWRPGNMVYPVPAVMVSLADKNGKPNIITVAWTGTVCSDPPMAYISVRKERYSHPILMETKEFVINLTTKQLAKATDFCGVRSGAEVDKFHEMHLTPKKASKVMAPLIEESPVNIECKVKQVIELGSHDMFLAEVVAVQVDEAYMDEKNHFDLKAAGLIAYSHGQYLLLGETIGTFGYSVRRDHAGSKKTMTKNARVKKINRKSHMEVKKAGSNKRRAERKNKNNQS